MRDSRRKAHKRLARLGIVGERDAQNRPAQGRRVPC
jgi:hypothetical protein